MKVTTIHPIQQKLLFLVKDQGAVLLKYREIGRKIGEKYPQTVKHHIELLANRNLIIIENGLIKVNAKNTENTKMLNLPFYGLANCGAPTICAQDKIEGFIKVSPSILPNKNFDNFFIIKAVGNSMNMAKVGKSRQNIENGDFVIVDTEKKAPLNDDYIVSVIDGCANIKKVYIDSSSNHIQLLSESTEDYTPIILKEFDEFVVVGTAIDVIKNMTKR